MFATLFRGGLCRSRLDLHSVLGHVGCCPHGETSSWRPGCPSGQLRPGDAVRSVLVKSKQWGDPGSSGVWGSLGHLGPGAHAAPQLPVFCLSSGFLSPLAGPSSWWQVGPLPPGTLTCLGRKLLLPIGHCVSLFGVMWLVDPQNPSLQPSLEAGADGPT